MDCNSVKNAQTIFNKRNRVRYRKRNNEYVTRLVLPRYLCKILQISLYHTISDIDIRYHTVLLKN